MWSTHPTCPIPVPSCSAPHTGFPASRTFLTHTTVSLDFTQPSSVKPSVTSLFQITIPPSPSTVESVFLLYFCHSIITLCCMICIYFYPTCFQKKNLRQLQSLLFFPFLIMNSYNVTFLNVNFSGGRTGQSIDYHHLSQEY